MTDKGHAAGTKTAALAKARLEKIVVNAGIGRMSTSPNFEDKVLPEVIKEFSLLAGQRPRTNRAKKSIAGFKLRAGTVVGLSVTLRGNRMAQFLNRLSMVVFPRVRDFRGVNPEHVDRAGNLTVGIREHIVFPEIDPETSKVNLGVEVTFVPRRIKDRTEAIGLYRELGLPLKK